MTRKGKSFPPNPEALQHRNPPRGVGTTTGSCEGANQSLKRCALIATKDVIPLHACPRCKRGSAGFVEPREQCTRLRITVVCNASTIAPQRFRSRACKRPNDQEEVFCTPEMRSSKPERRGCFAASDALRCSAAPLSDFCASDLEDSATVASAADASPANVTTPSPDPLSLLPRPDRAFRNPDAFESSLPAPGTGFNDTGFGAPMRSASDGRLPDAESITLRGSAETGTVPAPRRRSSSR